MPDDLKATAERLLRQINGHRDVLAKPACDQASLIAITAALKAEREACAKVAKRVGEENGRALTGDTIAAAIRART